MPTHNYCLDHYILKPLCIAALAVGLTGGTASISRAQSLPSDAKQTCIVPGKTLQTWFKAGSVTSDGVVEPPSGVLFKHQNNCQFYQWSEQMFLWLTSPSPPEYGGGNGRIYASPVFFGVSSESGGHRSFRPNDPLGPFGPFGPEPLGIRTLQKGRGGHQILFTKSGELAEVEPTPAGAKAEIRDAAGAKVVVAHATQLASGVLVLTSETNAAIQARPRLSATTAAARAALVRNTIPTLKVRKFVVDDNPIFIDANGDVVDVELGQAGGGDVLQAQNKSLVYYTISTNDVYAYFLTGVVNKKINTNNQFPTTAQQLKDIVDYAKTQGVTFPDEKALTVEIKTSWVEASGLPNLQTYLTMTATVPTYDTSNPSKWTVIPNKNRTVQLAMVGMHVVGSVAKHPELVWATFEHVANDPRGAYQYINTSGTMVTVPQQSGGPWTFTATNSAGPFNKPHMKVSGSDIVAVPVQANQTIQPRISPSDTIHWKAFGAAYATSPNPEDKTPAASNTEIISINNSIRGQLVGGDVRSNYILTGATWTNGGAAPNNTNQIGTSMLANSTMETYHQGASNADAGLNCFTCHAVDSGTVATTDVSHIFSAMNPLP